MHQNHTFTYYHKSQLKKELVKIPNILSIFRIIIALVMIILICTGIKGKIIFWMIVLGALSDTLDGNLARILNQRTNLGKLMDPIADKVFINTLLFFFYLRKKIPLYLLILNLIRDFFILSGGVYLLKKKIPLSRINPSLLGKASTVCEFLLFILIFTDLYFFKLKNFLHIFIPFTALLIFASGIHYFYVFIKLTKSIRE